MAAVALNRVHKAFGSTPVVHGVEYMREGYFGHVAVMYHDLWYMAAVNLVLTFIGLSLMRGAARQMVQR